MDKSEKDRMWAALSELEAKGELAANLSLCLEFVAMDPGNTNFHQMLGSCYFYRSDFKKAASEFIISIQLQSNNFVAHHNLAFIYAKFKEFDKAINSYQSAAELQPTNPGPQLGLGAAYYELRDRGNAIAAYAAAARLDPKCADAQFGLAKTHYMFKGIDAASLHFEAGLKLRPGDAEGHAGIAAICEHRGEVDRSVSEFAEAYRLGPKKKRDSTTLCRRTITQGSNWRRHSSKDGRAATAISCVIDSPAAGPSAGALSPSRIGRGGEERAGVGPG